MEDATKATGTMGSSMATACTIMLRRDGRRASGTKGSECGGSTSRQLSWALPMSAATDYKLKFEFIFNKH